ncbi:MAG: hypothetical protein M3322_00355 [Actinomycetota bacterium]|nr:hypothetical protein [Actinomycetota bacterium]
MVDPRRLLETLHRNGVEFIVVGAVAAILQGYPLATEDLDVTPAYDAENLERLTVALHELEARLRVAEDPAGLEFPVASRLLAQADVWTLTTKYGDLDLVFTPPGTRGYADLRRDAVEIDLGVPMLVASLPDVIRSKEAAGRPKDLAQLPALRQTLELVRERERRERERPSGGGRP